jgi:hypothetical protein
MRGIDHVVTSQTSSHPLFVQNTDHSSVPAKDRSAIARSGGQGRPFGRRDSALPLTAASTITGLRSLGILMCIAAMLAASMPLVGAVHAKQGASTTRRPNGFGRPSLRGIRRRFGVPEQRIRAVMGVESDGKQRTLSKRVP